MKYLSDFDLLLDLAVISSKIEIDRNVLKEKANSNQRDESLEEAILSSDHWRNLSKGYEIAKELGVRHRIKKVFPMDSFFWRVIIKSFRDTYEEEREYCHKVYVVEDDFEGICRSVIRKNQIICGSRCFKPLRLDEKTDAYGVDCLVTVWGESDNKEDFKDVLSEDDDVTLWSLVNRIFFSLNGSYPSKSDYGKYAEEINFLSHGYLDGNYIPLKIK